MRKVPAKGNPRAEIVFVGEAPGEQEEKAGEPFIGPSGHELDAWLARCNLQRDQVFITNVCKYRPYRNDIEHWVTSKKKVAVENDCKHFLDGMYYNDAVAEGLQELGQELATIQPRLVIPLGNTALWACAGKKGITSWAGSQIYTKWGQMCLPTYHPSAVLRMWEWREPALRDLSRVEDATGRTAWDTPEYRFIVRPSLDMVLRVIEALILRANRTETVVTVDTETRWHKHVSCIGLGWSRLHAICIPMLSVHRDTGYWSAEEEVVILQALNSLFKHPNIRLVLQNGLYDIQYFAREFGMAVPIRDDTMLMQHLIWPGMPKGLDFLSRMYCNFHRYWKDDGKEWNPKIHSEEQHWTYNATDCVTTYEVFEVLDGLIDHYGLRKQYQFRMGQLYEATLHTMLKGVRVDLKERGRLGLELLEALEERDEIHQRVYGFKLNPKSPQQMKALFYHDLGCPVQFNRKTRQPSLDKDALEALADKFPELRPHVELIGQYRSIGVFLSTFVRAPLDDDMRMRCSFNITGTETFRYSSSENAFGSGTNLQNIPKGEEDESESISFKLPNVRKIFLPDEGYEIADIDLAGADAQVVAWEANDEDLKAAFRANIKIHAHNAKALFPNLCGPDGKREPYYTRAKRGVHLTNYGGRAKTCAASLGITVLEAQSFQTNWFSLHPGIKSWHERIQQALNTSRTVRNAFGYRRVYFDRVDQLLPEALAWVPQSTVAIVAAFAWAALREASKGNLDLPWNPYNGVLPKLPAPVEVLLQVHDSLVIQYPIRYREECLAAIRKLVAVTVPYPDPLVIPWGLKTSTKSWGHCEDRKWPE